MVSLLPVLLLSTQASLQVGSNRKGRRQTEIEVLMVIIITVSSTLKAQIEQR